MDVGYIVDPCANCLENDLKQEQQLRSLIALERLVTYLFMVGGGVVLFVGAAYGLWAAAIVLALALWGCAFLLRLNMSANQRKLDAIPGIRETERLQGIGVIESLSKEFDSTTVEDASGAPSFSTFVGGRSVQFRAAGKSLIISSLLPMGNFRLFIYPESQMAVGFRNVVDVSVSDREFDRRFTIQTNDSAQARKFLSGPIKVAIHELADLVGRHPFGFTLNNGQVRFFLPLDDSPKSKIVQHSIWVLELIQLELNVWSDDTVLEILPDNIEEEVANCLVCGDPVSSQRVDCRQCRTPHHRECWDYIGKCSVFGCGSTRSK